MTYKPGDLNARVLLFLERRGITTQSLQRMQMKLEEYAQKIQHLHFPTQA